MGKKKGRTLSEDQVKKLAVLFDKRLKCIQTEGSASVLLTYENIAKSAKCTPLTAKRHWDKFLASQGLRSKFGKIERTSGGLKMKAKNGHEVVPSPATEAKAPTAKAPDGNFKAWLQLGTGSGYVATLVAELKNRIDKALHGE